MGSVTEIILPMVLAFMMFTLGLGLQVSDFTRILAQPKDVIIGLVMQVLVLPVVGFSLISIWPLSPEIAIGVMLIAVAPGGVTSNYLTALARGDVALSVSLTAVTSLLSIITIPAILAFVYVQVMDGELAKDISFTKTAVSIFLIVTLPVVIGMTVRRFFETGVLKIEPKAHILSTVFFVLVLAGAILQQRENVVAYFAEAGLVTLALNVIMMVLAFWTARALNCDQSKRIAICIECGLQNGTLAIAIGVLLFGGGAYLIPAATYSLIMFGSSVVFLAIARKWLAPKET
jgi:BASS family bile acid:Na+ symporter